MQMPFNIDPSGVTGAQQNPYGLPAQGFGGGPMSMAAPQGQSMVSGGPQPGAAGMGTGGQLDPSLVNAVIGLQGNKAGADKISRQRALADQLKQQAGQQMQGQAHGGIYTAPNLLNAAASVYGQYKAGQLQQDADLQQQNMDVGRQDALRRYFQAATNQKQAPLGYMGEEGE